MGNYKISCQLVSIYREDFNVQSVEQPKSKKIVKAYNVCICYCYGGSTTALSQTCSVASQIFFFFQIRCVIVIRRKTLKKIKCASEKE